MTDKKTQGYINVHDVDPDIIVDLKYATTDNFTHQVVYDFDQAISRIDTVHKLAKASKDLKSQGYRIKIWDAYRPTYAQKRLFEVYPTQSGLPNRIQTSVTKKGLPLTSH